jgi:hypothetical protein
MLVTLTLQRFIAYDDMQMQPFVDPMPKEQHALYATTLSPLAIFLVVLFLARQSHARAQGKGLSLTSVAVDVVLCATASVATGFALLFLGLCAGIQM